LNQIRRTKATKKQPVAINIQYSIQHNIKLANRPKQRHKRKETLDRESLEDKGENDGVAMKEIAPPQQASTSMW